jgi:predicted transposase/invertase (TIGR01784 family)
MPPNIHDAIFKATFSQVEHAAGELRLVLPPDLVARLDLGSLALCPGSFVDEALKERQSDLLFSVGLAGRRALLYVLFEHQSRAEELMPFRLLRYEVRIWEAWSKEHPDARKLPPILPVILHHSERGWTAATAFEDVLDVDADTLALLADYVPRFRFVLDDISLASDEALKARAMSALARLVLWCLRHAREPGELVERLGQWLDVVSEARRAPNGAEALQRIWRYIFATNEPEKPEDLVQRLLLVVGQEEREEIMTAADQLMERGFQKGQRATLLKLLQSRFGALPSDVVAKVNGADTSTLDRWVERVLTAATLADVLRDE